MLTLNEIMTRCPVIPVIVIQRIEDAVPLATALVKGGLTVLEVTLRTECGLAAIKAIKQQVPQAIVGAGTVVTVADLDKALQAGAEFIVSPGSTPALIDAALQQSVPILPGVATVSEAMVLMERGLQALKFFPAQASGGVAMLKAFAGPLPQLRFCPTGGITEANAKDYLALANVSCVGGTWMLEQALIDAKNWPAIEQRAKIAAALLV